MARSLERTFLGWDAPFLPRAADALAEAIARDRGRPEVVVLPGRRAARRLEELLAARLDPAAAPPRLVTESGLPSALCVGRLPLAPRLAVELAWIGALRGLAAPELERAFGRAPGRDDLPGWLALARGALRTAEVLAAGSLDFAAAVERAGERLGASGRARWSLLARAQAASAAALGRAGLSDPSRSALDAHERGLAGPELRVWLLALADLDGARKQLLERFAGDVHALVFAPCEHASGFDAFGALRAESWADRDVPLADAQWHVAAGPEACGAELVRWLREMAGSGLATDEVTLGVLDGELAAHIERATSAAGLRVRAAAGAPIEPTLPARALRAAADFVRGRGSDAFAGLVRHPAVERWLSTEVDPLGEDPVSLVDAYRLEHLPPRVEAPWLAGRTPTEPLERLAVGLDALLGGLAGTRTAPLSAWAAEAGGFLARLWPEVRREPADEAAWTLLESLEACASALREARDLVGGPLDTPGSSAAEALALLCARLEGTRVALPPDPDALEVTGWLELVLDEAPRLLLAGFDEGAVPAPAAGDPLLSEALRAELGLPEERRRVARDVWAATALLACRKQEDVRVVSVRTGRDGDPRRASRLVFHAPAQVAVQRVRRFFQPQGEARTGAGADEAPARPVLPFARPRAVESMSVTAFGDYLASPYRFYLRHVLGLERVEDPQLELDPAAFGVLAHDALRDFGRGPRAGSTSAEAIEEELGTVLERLAARRYGTDLPAAVRLQLQQLRHRFAGFARWQAEQALAGWRIARVEFEPAVFALDVDGAPMPVRGRIDRLDRHAVTGAWRVIDYKTGEKGDGPAAAPREPGGWKDLQLPLYHTMLRDELEGGDLQLGFVVVPKARDSVGFKAADYSEGQLADALETARAVVRQVRAGAFADPGDLGRRWEDPLLAAIAGVGLLADAGEDGEDGEDETEAEA